MSEHRYVNSFNPESYAKDESYSKKRAEYWQTDNYSELITMNMHRVICKRVKEGEEDGKGKRD